MPAVQDGLDALLLGCFLFGLLLAAGAALLGLVDLGDAGHPLGGHDGPHEGALPFGLTALLVAVAWFGGVGFLLRNGAGWPPVLALVVAAAIGVAAGAIVQRLVRALVRAGRGELRADAYRLPGTIGRVAGGIRAGGIGEVIYEQGGVRQVIAARAEGGSVLPAGTEVVLLRVADGIATVTALEPLLGEGGDGDPVTAQPRERA